MLYAAREKYLRIDQGLLQSFKYFENYTADIRELFKSRTIKGEIRQYNRHKLLGYVF